MSRHALEPLVRAFREEPKLRAFALAHFVDDVGVAVAAWASMLLMTNLFTSQAERAKLMLPSLLAFLVGTVVSGPLADGARRRLSGPGLARYRHALVVGSRFVEGALLVLLVALLATGKPTIGRILPFVVLSAFTKTAFRPARIAFAVDILQKESPVLGADGSPARDEHGAPLMQKTHLVAASGVTSALQAAATLLGLLVGGKVLAAAHGSYAPLFLAQAALHLAFAGMLAFSCHPTLRPGELTLASLLRREPEVDAHMGASSAPAMGFFRQLGQGVRFLARRDQRPLALLLVGTALVELVTESYDGKMMVKHVLHGSDDAVRYAEIVWSVVAVLGVLAVPVLVRAKGKLAKVFVALMLLDGLVIAFAGKIAGAEASSRVVPFVAVLALDHALTQASTTLAELAQASASSAGMRGRIAGTYALFVIVGDMIVEGLASSAAEAMGLPAMLVRVGLLQVGVVAVLVAFGGRRLLAFGLASETPETAPVDSSGLVGERAA
jgi:hypothetical protein